MHFRCQFYYGFYIKLFSAQIRILNPTARIEHSNCAQHGHLLKKTLPVSSIRRYLFGSLTLLQSLYVGGFVHFRCQFYYGFYIKLFSTQIRILNPTARIEHSNCAQHGHLLTKTASLSSIRWYLFGSLTLSGFISI